MMVPDDGDGRRRSADAAAAECCGGAVHVVVQFVDQILPDLMAGRPIQTVTTEASIKGELRVASSPLFVDVEREVGHGGTDDGESEQPEGDPSAATD